MGKLLVIAELGSNWDPADPLGSIGAMMDAAKEAGADAVKLQDWHPIEGMNRSDEWKERCGPWTLQPELRDPRTFSKPGGLAVLRSVFTLDALKWAWPSLKIASSEICNQQLLWHIGEHAVNVYLSIGEAPHVNAISTAIARLARCRYITLMACISEYPVKRALDLYESLMIAQTFGLPTGVSSHLTYQDALKVLPACVRRGAEVVELHLRVEGVTPEDAPDNGDWALWPHEFKEVVGRLNAV